MAKPKKVSGTPLASLRKAWSPLMLAAAVAGLIGALLLIVTGAIWIIKKEFFLWIKILLAVGAALVVFCGAIYRRPLWSALSSRGAQHGYVTGFTILFVLVIVVCLNYALYLFHWRKDLTKSQLYALAPQTLKVINGLGDKKVQIRSYLFPGDFTADPAQVRAMTELLEEYTKRSKNISFETIDLRMPSKTADQDDITSPCVVFQCGDRKEKVYGYDANESKFTSALIKVTREKKRKIYFLTGHGERPLEAPPPPTPSSPGMPPPRRTDLDSLSFFKQALEQIQSREFATLDLAKEEMPSPEDCAALIIAGPKGQIPDDQIEKIDGYLKKGGGVLVMVDPPNQGGADVNKLISRWGFETPNERVEDHAQNYRGNPSILMVRNYTEDPFEITYRLPATIYIEARPVLRTGTTNPDLTLIDLVKTSTNSYALEDQPKGLLAPSGTPGSGGQGEPKPPSTASKRNGPLTLVALATTQKPPPPPPQPGMPPPPPPQEDATKPKSRLVVIGDSDLAANRGIASQGFFGMELNANGYLLLNCVAWLAQEPELVSIPAKKPEDQHITLQRGQVALMIIIVLPVTLLLIIASGAVVWWMRR